MKKLLLLLTLLLWLPIAQANQAEHQKGVQAEYQKGVDAYKLKKYKTAFTILKPLAEQGDTSAQNKLGLMYLFGYGVKKGHGEAFKWFSKAATQENAEAQNNLGLMYSEGLEVEKDYGEAIKWYRKAATQGVAQAQNNLGDMYYKGKGVPPNSAEALKWYRKAATQGHVDAQDRIAWMYKGGKGVPKNYIYSYMWFSILGTNEKTTSYYKAKGAAEIKHLKKDMSSEELTKAQALTTRCWESKYQDCSEIAQANTDFATSQPLAKQGDAEAQYNLGVMYYKGQEVPQNYIYSYMWLSLAKVNSVDKAQKVIELLTKQMPSESIEKAQALAAKCWQSKYQDCF